MLLFGVGGMKCAVVAGFVVGEALRIPGFLIVSLLAMLSKCFESLCIVISSFSFNNPHVNMVRH